MELVEYIRLFRKWFWLFVLAGLLAGGVSYLVRSRQPLVYQAQVLVSVGGFIQSPNPDSGEIRTGVELAQTYAVLATTYDVLEAAIEARDLPLTVPQLREALETQVVPNTSLLKLSVTYPDPILAADIVNEVARQLILNSPTNLTAEQQNQIDLANAEIARLNAQLEELRAQLQLVDSQLETATGQSDVDQLRAQRTVLVDQINQASANLAQFSNTVANLQERTNSLDIVEQARIPTEPSGLGLLNTVLLGAIVGMALAGGIVVLVESLDDTISTPEEATQLLALPVLGVILKFGKSGDDYTRRLITFEDPGSPVSEGYRALRTNLLFASDSQGKKAYIITSPSPAEGKSVTAANLAVAMAAAGVRVLLVDADLRRPKLHQIFGLPNKVGLTTLLSADPGRNMPQAENGVNLSNGCRECLQETSIPGLRVITSGFLPSNPTEALGSALMRRWFEIFISSSNVDVVLFDTPPSLVVADSSVLAAATGASVVFVLEAGRTRRRAALRAKEQFDQLHLDIKGTILNLVDPREMGQGYGYGEYYYYYYSSDVETPNQHNGRLRLGGRAGVERQRSEADSRDKTKKETDH